MTRPALPVRNEIWRFGVGGIGFVALYTVLLNFGELTVSAGAASFIINVSPILTAHLAMTVLGERFSRLAWMGTLCPFGGIGIIALGEGERAEASTPAHCLSSARRSAPLATLSCRSHCSLATSR